ncbi:snRNA-activating protein complex subunit 1 isoform X3 [Tympanuchus pallidicinctus]|uniref:snRNA-activating protein complex subunit 1 isoform X3 n=1 Tax=Tympanuchus pallidicinctus TaxID=109042 RepID=UPI0022872797|nr:snRNA-activating protein complex subunit 1 isoform X3 [Tympanuchus pallidicinctus]
MSVVPGLQEDCEALLGAFQEADTVRFERFAELWRERRFHTIFHGRMRALERNKITKKTLELAQQYFLPPYAFQIRVGALYLLYGLYNTQLCQPKIKLNYRTKKKIQENECKEEFKDPSNRVSSLITNDVLEELMNIHEHYQKMKCAISADKSQPDKALSLIKEEFVVSLKDMALEHQEWQQKRLKLLLKAKEDDEMPNRVEEGTSLRSEGSERADALARIKHKSYSAVVEASKSRRHRQVVLESSESGLDYGKSPKRSKKSSRRPQPAEKRGSLEIRGRMQAEKETVTRHIGMPVITEEDSSDTEEVPVSKRRRR